MKYKLPIPTKFEYSIVNDFRYARAAPVPGQIILL